MWDVRLSPPRVSEDPMGRFVQESSRKPVIKSSNVPVRLKYIYETSAKATSLDIAHLVIQHSNFSLVPPGVCGSYKITYA